MAYIIPLEYEFDIEKSRYIFLEWLRENNIEFEIRKDVMRQASGFPKGWISPGPAIVFKYEEDAIAFKLRWTG